MENPYATSTTLVLTEQMPDSIYRSLLSKNLTTTTTQFNAVLNDEGATTSGEGTTEDRRPSSTTTGAEAGTSNAPISSSAAAGGGLKGAYMIKTSIKSPAALLNDVDTESSLGLTAVDALAALFPPTPVSAGAAPFDPSAAAAAASAAAAADATQQGDDFNTTAAAVGNMISVARIDHADRMDVINLQERILQLLEEGNAKPVGICPVREGIYNKAFLELIRQVAILCPERGLLLSELRKEMSETDTTYDLLFDTACQYAVRKAISRDLGRTMLQEMEDLSSEVRTAENRVSELRAKYEGQQKRAAETRAASQKVHDEEVAFIKRGTQQLTQEIKRLTAQGQ